MARPKVPLIDRAEVVAKALEIIDRDGLEGFSIRGIGRELGVNGASLYHHFSDKEAILHGVRMLIIRESRVADRPRPADSWQDYLRRTTTGYRRSLLRHPNAAVLVAPTIVLRPFSFRMRDHVASMLLAEGVPVRLAFPIIDSLETLAYSSALLNPTQLAPQTRLRPRSDDQVPALARSMQAAPRSAHRMFDLQLDALIEGWTVLVERGRDDV
jgi:AcrR family transcriptional regulator